MGIACAILATYADLACYIVGNRREWMILAAHRVLVLLDLLFSVGGLDGFENSY